MTTLADRMLAAYGAALEDAIIAAASGDEQESIQANKRLTAAKWALIEAKVWTRCRECGIANPAYQCMPNVCAEGRA